MYHVPIIQVLDEVLRTADLLPYSQRVQRHVITVHNMMQDLFTATGTVDVSSTQELRKIETNFYEAREISSNVSSKMDWSVTILPGNSSRYHLVRNTRNYMDMLLQWQSSQVSRIHFLQQNIHNFSTSLSQLELNVIHYELASLNNSCDIFFGDSVNLTQDALQVHKSIAMEATQTNFSEYDLARTASLLMLIQIDMDDFFSLNQVSDGAISSPGTVESGSGSGSLEMGSSSQEDLLPVPSTPTINSLLRSLSRNISQLDQQLQQLSPHLQIASNISTFSQFAGALNTCVVI